MLTVMIDTSGAFKSAQYMKLINHIMAVLRILIIRHLLAYCFIRRSFGKVTV